MMIEISAENGMKKFLVANILTLLAALGTLIWNVATMSNTFGNLQDDVELIQDIQIRQQGQITDLDIRTTATELGQRRLLGAVDRLEGLHFDLPEDLPPAPARVEKKDAKASAGGS